MTAANVPIIASDRENALREATDVARALQARAHAALTIERQLRNRLLDPSTARAELARLSLPLDVSSRIPA